MPRPFAHRPPSPEPGPWRLRHAAERQLLVTLLRELRQSAGITQTELATRLQRPQSFVSKYEQGQRRLDLVELRAVCQALGADLVGVVRRFERRSAANQ